MKIQNPKSLLPWLAILVVVLAWFSPWWIGGKNLAPLDLQNLMMSPWRDGNEAEYARNHFVADGVDQYLVYRMVAAESYAKEGWLGWSSLTYGGTAQYANTMALYFDWTMQLHRCLDFWTAWHLGLLGQVLLAAIGMFLFLRGRSVGAWWAVCGGLAYALNSQFVTWTYHRWALGSFCWVPWILWSMDGWRRGSRIHWSLAPVFMGMAFLGGTLQHAVLVVLAVAAMWLEEAIQQHPRTSIKRQGRLLARYATWGILGCGIAAMMFLPCTDAFLTSNRLGLHMGMNVNADKSIYPMGPLQPLFNLAAYPLQVFPSILGRCDSMDLLKLFKSELFFVCYFGSLPVIAGFLAIRGKQFPLVSRILVWMGLLIPLTPLVRFLYQRCFLLFIIGGILAFVIFMQDASRETRIRLFRFLSISVCAGIAVWTCLSIYLKWQPERLAGLRHEIVAQGGGSSFGYFQSWLSLRAERFTHDLFIWSDQQWMPLALFLIALAGLRITASRAETWRQTGALLVGAAVLCEVSLFASRWVVWSDPAHFEMFRPTAESEVLREQVDRDARVTTLIHPTAHMARTPFIPNTLSAYGIATISGYDSIIPNGMILPKEAPGDARRLGRLAVSHLVTWSGNPEVPADWTPVWQGAMMDLYQNPFTVSRYVGFASDSAMTRFFDGGDAEFTIVEETSGVENRRDLRVPQGLQWVRIAENQADGWKYRQKGSAKWLPVARAPDASMLLENTGHEQPTHLEMSYDPPLRKTGFSISAVCLFVLMAAPWIIGRIRRLPIDRDAKPGRWGFGFG
ncbi:MAG: hypothetical protein WEB53_05170 [Akkermansiaceae bacterium]